MFFEVFENSLHLFRVILAEIDNVPQKTQPAFVDLQIDFVREQCLRTFFMKLPFGFAKPRAFSVIYTNQLVRLKACYLRFPFYQRAILNSKSRADYLFVQVSN